MTNDSPFSGGGGVQTPQDPNRPVPQSIQDLITMLNTKSVQRFLIDPDGVKMEIAFAPSGICTIKGGEIDLHLPFKKL